MKRAKLIFGNCGPKTRFCSLLSATLVRCVTTAVGLLGLVPVLLASENVPHRPFAEWAEVPTQGQLVFGLVYEESEAYRIWAGHDSHNITVRAGGENYGIDITQGYMVLQYGITEKWAADLSLGGTTLGWRAFDDDGTTHATTGLMDWAFGVRYQILNETNTDRAWFPTLTFRAGAILPGTYAQHIAFSPGVRSAAIEPEFLLRKHFGWPGLGVYADGLYRWNRTTGNDQYIASVGLSQQIKGWELDAGYRHLQTLSGGDIVFDPNDPASIVYPRDTRENNDSIEAGFSYTTAKACIRYAFQSRTVFDGSNTDRKFWLGASIQIPIDTWFSRQKGS